MTKICSINGVPRSTVTMRRTGYLINGRREVVPKHMSSPRGKEKSKVSKKRKSELEKPVRRSIVTFQNSSIAVFTSKPRH